MPYQDETASKSSHFDIIKNPEIEQFLAECEYLTAPSDEEVERLAKRFQPISLAEDPTLPANIVAFDGSRYESSIDQRLPSTKIGYVKVGSVLINRAEFGALRVHNGRFVDPFRVAALQNANSPLTFVLPSANIQWRGRQAVRDGFRAAVDDQLLAEKTRFDQADPRTSLRTTLFHLAAHRTGELATNDPSRLLLHRCPTCGRQKVEVQDTAQPQFCPRCKAEVFPSDCLRLWEEVEDYQSNVLALTRFMTLIEHLLPIHYMRYLAQSSLSVLGSMAFFVDGPLAVFGTSAWLHATILRFLADVTKRLKDKGEQPPLVIGLQKSGGVVDHVGFIERFVKPGSIMAIDDEYRYRYVLQGRDPSDNGFGSETYYGQDFIYKTPSGRTFVFALPYPVRSKQAIQRFHELKADLGRYADLPRALALLHHFETDLYRNAVIPIALAHRYTAISLMPGGRVLDLLTKGALAGPGD